jgi:hypothetical protein
MLATGVTPSGRCEEIEKLVWGNFGSKKSRARMPSKRSLGHRHTFCISLDFGQIDFFTSSCPRFPCVPVSLVPNTETTAQMEVISSRIILSRIIRIIKLQAEQGPVEYYVIDHVDKPSEN